MPVAAHVSETCNSDLHASLRLVGYHNRSGRFGLHNTAIQRMQLAASPYDVLQTRGRTITSLQDAARPEGTTFSYSRETTLLCQECFRQGCCQQCMAQQQRLRCAPG